MKAKKQKVLRQPEIRWNLLKNIAKSQRKKSHAPYSKCFVGAALLGRSGKIYSGCNVENASFGATLCAERTAIAKAVSEGEKKFIGIAICTQASPPWAPCGICRQVLAEFTDPEHFEILLFNLKRHEEKFTLNELFPLGFSPSQYNGQHNGKNTNKHKGSSKPRQLRMRKEISGTL